MKRIRTLSISPHSHTQITLASKCYPAIAGDKKDDCLELSRVGTRRMLHILRSCQHSKDAFDELIKWHSDYIILLEKILHLFLDGVYFFSSMEKMKTKEVDPKNVKNVKFLGDKRSRPQKFLLFTVSNTTSFVYFFSMVGVGSIVKIKVFFFFWVNVIKLEYREQYPNFIFSTMTRDLLVHPSSSLVEP